MILRAESCTKIENKYYFMAVDVNAFYSIDIKTKKIIYEGEIPNENTNIYRAAKIMGYNRNLVFIPLNSKYVSIYNIDKKNWKQIKVQDMGKYDNDKFFSAYIYENKLFLIGACYPAIMIIDMSNYNVKYEKRMFDERIYDKEKSHDCIIRSDIVCVKNKLYMASCVSNHIGVFNLDDYSWKWISVGKDKNRYSGIAWDGEYFWLSPRYFGSVIKWNPYNNECKKTDIKGKNFLGVIYDGTNLVFPGAHNNKTVIINNKNNNIKIMEEDYIFYLNDGEDNCAMTSKGEFVIYNTNNMLHQSLKFNVNINSHEILQKIISSGKICNENTYIQMTDFLKEIVINNERINVYENK